MRLIIIDLKLPLQRVFSLFCSTYIQEAGERNNSCVCTSSSEVAVINGHQRAKSVNDDIQEAGERKNSYGVRGEPGNESNLPTDLHILSLHG